MGERGGRAEHPVALRAQPRQPNRHLARHALHPADVRTDGGPGIDHDGHGSNPAADG